MPIDVFTADRIAMSQGERDVLKVMHGVLQGERTQADAAHLLGFSARHVRRLQRRLEAEGDGALVHGLRGKPSNHRTDPAVRAAVLAAYRRRYADFGPTFASEKLAREGLHVGAQTLRRWLIAEGLWQRQRRRDPHRSRRPRRACFGDQCDRTTDCALPLRIQAAPPLLELGARHDRSRPLRRSGAPRRPSHRPTPCARWGGLRPCR